MTNPLEGTLERRDDAWVLTLVRDFAQPPEKVWPWLIDAERLRQWSPIVRWRLSAVDSGCRLTLEQTMRERDHAAMNAAGWQICLDVLDDVLGGADRARVVGSDAEAHGWQALRDRYAELLGV